MHTVQRRTAAAASLRRILWPIVSGLAFTLINVISAHAVVVRGRVTTPQGAPLPGARVQLVEAGKVIAFTDAGPDGGYEIRSAAAGRFTLLGSGGDYLPSIGIDFYAGATDVVDQDVVLSKVTVRQEVSVTATGIPTPLPQLTAPAGVLGGEAFDLRLGVNEELRQLPGEFVVQSGQTGGVTSLFVRGGNSTANLVLIDGVPANEIGGIYDYGTVSSTGIAQVEVYRGPDSATFGTDAGAGVVAISTPRASSLKPQITYTGQGGNLHTYRNEGTLEGSRDRFDYFVAASRLDTSNALPLDRFHVTTEAVNLGYAFSGATTLRATLRNARGAQGIPDAHDFYGISSNGKQADQDLYGGVTLENRWYERWHNLVRYGVARVSEQAKQFTQVGTPISVFGFTEYFGNAVTIRGANGYTATGQAAFFNPNDDLSNHRDQLYVQSDYAISSHHVALFGFRYDNERGRFNDADFFEHRSVQRTNFEYNLQFQGSFFQRLFYSLGGAVEKNHLYGVAGTPRVGLAYMVSSPQPGWFHGTRLRANAATGVQEPTLALEYAGLYTQLLEQGDTADIAKYHVGPQAAERSRNYDVGVDQSVYGDKLTVKVGWFHNNYDRQLEGITQLALVNIFKINIPTVYEAYVNSLAYTAQGEELQVDWHPTTAVIVRGGYTHLDTKVVQSFADDAYFASQGFPTTNPNLPNIAIGAESPLRGARVFRRPPHYGYFAALYNKPKYTLALKGALASRSDDSTFLDYSDTNGDNTLILPNRDLDFGYVKLDLGGTYQATSRTSVFAQFENLLNDQHIGPIGYPGLPLTFRAGVKVRLGGD